MSTNDTVPDATAPFPTECPECHAEAGARCADQSTRVWTIEGGCQRTLAADPRAAFITGLRELADFLDENPEAPLPLGSLSRHFEDADEFGAAAAAIGAPIGPSYAGSDFDHCQRRFGPVVYGVQTNGRREQQIRLREQAIAAREAELGLSPVEVTT